MSDKYSSNSGRSVVDSCTVLYCTVSCQHDATVQHTMLQQLAANVRLSQKGTRWWKRHFTADRENNGHKQRLNSKCTAILAISASSTSLDDKNDRLGVDKQTATLDLLRWRCLYLAPKQQKTTTSSSSSNMNSAACLHDRRRGWILVETDKIAWP